MNEHVVRLRLGLLLGAMTAGLSLPAAGASFYDGSAIYSDSSMHNAPPPFEYRDGTVVPVDLETVDIEYTFDVQSLRASARATVQFSTDHGGFPIIDLVPEPTALALDGEALDPALFATIDDPARVTKMRVLRQNLPADSQHTLVIDYRLMARDVTFTNGRARSGFFMSDLDALGRRFFEQYGPANYEFDQVRYRFSVKVVGTQVEHEIFANGTLNHIGPNHWVIDFPSYFTASSPYFHLAEKNRFVVEKFTYDGLEGPIPVTVYAESASLVRSGVTRSRSVMAELEGTYGAYAHDGMTVYLTPTGGGMEHAGATITSLSALGHEMTHFWFARGVMPVNGNAGWIDEAVASWRDNGYPRAAGVPNRSPVNLGGFSPYRRHTSRDAYGLGARLISEFDHMFAKQGGMKAALRLLYQEKQRTAIDVGFFQRFLESFSGGSLDAVFGRYVYGRSQWEGFELIAPERFESVDYSRHPRPYTQAELARYR